MRFLKLCFSVTPSVLADVYGLAWRTLMNPSTHDAEGNKIGPLGLVVVLLAQLIKIARALWVIFNSFFIFIGYASLILVVLSVCLAFPFLWWMWAPLTAWRVLRYEKMIDKQYENWEKE